MSPALIDLEPFRHEIEMRVAGGDTHAQIRQWLTTKGAKISKNAFSRRCVSWEASRRTRLSNEDPDLVVSNRRSLSHD
jgi:IS5 family transposase